jgi:acetoin utilization deacetylase AcuC-like enzyme
MLMQAVYDAGHAVHDPGFFLVRGRPTRSTELPERAERLLSGLQQGRHEMRAPERFGLGPVVAVHTPQYLRFLEEAHELWSKLDDAAAEIIPNIHPFRAPSGLAPIYPAGIVGRAGWHMADTACPIGPATWEAAQLAADVALTAAKIVMAGERAAYALCRPPGHHAYADMAGGFCFLNNTAIAAQHLRQRHQRVAILDVDVHHGNGTQGIFWRRGDVLTVSLHADPSSYYPFFCGYASERGEGDGEGRNLNLPLSFGTGDDAYIAALASAERTIRLFAPGALVVALGLDASEQDPLGPLKVTTDGFERIGAAIARLGVPTVLVQEGGYLSPILGANLAAVLKGFETAA